MKKICLFLAVFTAVLVLFPVSASAQLVRYDPFFGWGDAGQTRQATAPAVAPDDTDDIVVSEVERTLSRRGLIPVAEGEYEYEANVLVSKTLVTYHTYYYHNRYTHTYYKYDVYVKILNVDRKVIAVGRGEKTNLRKAAESAANEAADKLKKGDTVHIVAP